MVNLPQKKLIIGALIVSGLMIIGSLIFVRFVNKPKIITPSPLPSPKQATIDQLTTAKQFSFFGCNIKKEGNPIVHEMIAASTKDKDLVFGTFFGNINKISFDTAKKTASIQIISPKGDQTYSFKVTDSKGLVYDSTIAKPFNFADLKAGQTVMISFNCFPKETGEKQFKIAQIMVTGR